MTIDQPLTCACCGTPMAADDAAMAPEGLTPALYYHADFQACVRAALASLATASPLMRAMLGAPPPEEVVQ